MGVVVASGGHGILLPESVLHHPAFGVLAAFVAINTLVYCVLALGKLLPKVYWSDIHQPENRRSETRNIDPDAPVYPPGAP